MIVATIKWNPMTDEVKINFADDFKKHDDLTQADILQDIKAQIDEAYEKAVEGAFS